ncbi:cytochrome P450 2K4-like [Mobula birostris]|uniref:cytochrome P450 2K4-like n=1 Tax=Mobula birostris TaxID=1983395 RepID=UPI003B281E41
MGYKSKHALPDELHPFDTHFEQMGCKARNSAAQEKACANERRSVAAELNSLQACYLVLRNPAPDCWKKPEVKSYGEMSFAGVYSLDAVTFVLLCTLTALFVAYFRTGSKSPGETNFPGGPTPLPIIGNLHLLDLKKPHQSLMELSEKYGPIFSIKLGTMRAVVLTGYETVKDALINHPDEFGGRPHIPILDDLTHGYGILFANGESWKQMRRFTMSTLRDFGMGKKTVEDKIIEEAQFLIKLLESCKGQEFNPTIQLNAAVANIICSIVFGNRFEYDDERFITLVKRVNENIQLAGSPTVQLYNAFPILGFLPGSHKKMLKNVKSTCEFVKNFINESRQTLDANVPRSFIDVFILKQQQESGNPNTYFHENNLLFTVTNLFAAGMETTSTTLRWAMLLMMKYPQIQEKVHEEITTMIGSEQFPRTGDRKNLPYTDAVIHEIQRFANILPLSILHSTTEDVIFKGYFLPKGTPVIPLLTSVLYDKTQWENPNDFNPSNFLDADGKFVKRDAFSPFSMGRRACAGESLARMELFLFFTILIQRFRFQVPPNVSNLELVSGVGFTSFPKYQNMCAVRR